MDVLHSVLSMVSCKLTTDVGAVCALYIAAYYGRKWKISAIVEGITSGYFM